jgi:hypothetical protein
MPPSTVQTELSDPWESPPLPPDTEAIALSQRLMSEHPAPESCPGSADLSGAMDSTALQEIRLQVVQLEADKRRLIDRNATLRAEVAQLQIRNQTLQRQLDLVRPPQPWWASLFPRWGRGEE